MRDNSKINPDALMRRFYGVANINVVDYRVMTLMKEENKAKRGNGIHSYEVQKIEVLDETPNTPNGTDGLNSELEASSAVANYFGNSRNGLIIARLCFKQMLPKRKRKTPLKFAGEVEFYLWEVGLCHLQDVS